MAPHGLSLSAKLPWWLSLEGAPVADLPFEDDEDAGWTIGHMEDVDGQVSYIEGRELSDQQIADYREAVGFVVEYQDQPAFRLVVGNYREYRALEAAMDMALTTQTVQTAFPPGEHLFQLRRTLLNWLTAVRFLDDYTSARLTRTYGNESRERKRYTAARAAAYDNVACYSYRFVCQLRHYAQHCGMVPVQGQIHIDGTGRNLELYFDRDELLAKFTNWKKVKSDLIAGPARLNPDDHIEAAMTAIMGLVSTVREIDQQRFERSTQVMREVVGPPPEDPGHRPVIFRVKRLDLHAGAIAMETLPVMLPNVQRDRRGANRGVPIPDFRAERPALQVDRQDYSCQGPMNRVTHLPLETCTARATTLFFFPHQEGVAFVFGCDKHALALGRWAGQRFGGCFGDSVFKAPRLMEQASNRVARVDLPHGEDFDQLLPVPNPPQVQSPLS